MDLAVSRWDAFICHATEDKDEIARPLAENLTNLGLNVWYDEFTLKVGDSLRQKIDFGLINSDFGIVILSNSFFLKNWPKKELDGLYAKAADLGRKVILPVWHNLSRKDVYKYSPTMADLVALSTKDGIDSIGKKLVNVIKNERTRNENYDTTKISLGDIHASVVFSAEYGFVSTFGSRGSNDGEFVLPEGIDVDSSGNLYVAEQGNNRVQKFDSYGTFITQFGTFIPCYIV